MKQITEDVIFLIGKEPSEFLKIRIKEYSYPNSTDYWDGNWLNSEIIIKVGGFSAHYNAQLRNTDFKDLMIGLEQIFDDLKGSTHLVTTEDYLRVDINGDGLGHFFCECFAIDDPNEGNRLNFSLRFDQTEIPDLIKLIDKILGHFPIKDLKKPNT